MSIKQVLYRAQATATGGREGPLFVHMPVLDAQGALVLEAPFWARDPVFSHLHYARPQSLQQQQQEEGRNQPNGGGNKESGPTITQIFAKLPDSPVADEDQVVQLVLKVLARRPSGRGELRSGRRRG